MKRRDTADTIPLFNPAERMRDFAPVGCDANAEGTTTRYGVALARVRTERLPVMP